MVYVLMISMTILMGLTNPSLSSFISENYGTWI